MDAKPFVRPVGTTAPSRASWIRPWINAACGASMIWIAARVAAPVNMLLAGWIGMIGTVIILYFGFFQLLAVLWRARGVSVEPLMNRPISARSLADFWSRWNLAFRDTVFRLIVRPLRRPMGPAGATYCAFLVSGLVHELLISLTGRGGYGMPTLYFLFQGAGVLIEKSPLGRRISAPALRALMYIILLAPLGMLFHPTFVHNVFIPFMTAIRAIPNTGGAS
jgi:hypothetical protein